MNLSTAGITKRLAEAADKFSFLAKVIGGTVGTVLVGLALYWRGSREKKRAALTT